MTPNPIYSIMLTNSSCSTYSRTAMNSSPKKRTHSEDISPYSRMSGQFCTNRDLNCTTTQRRGPAAAAVMLLGKVMKIKALRLAFFVVSDHQIGHRLGGGSFRLIVRLLLALLFFLGLFGLLFLT